MYCITKTLFHNNNHRTYSVFLTAVVSGAAEGVVSHLVVVLLLVSSLKIALRSVAHVLSPHAFLFAAYSKRRKETLGTET